MQQSPMTGGQKGRSPKSAGRTQTRRRNGLGCLLLAAGLVLAAAALFKLEKPRLFDRVVPPGLYREVPPVTQLHPVLDRKKDELISLAAAKGIKVVITDGFRSSAEQDVLYSKGREGGGSIVTHARGGESYHNYGLAIDFALKDRTGDIIWDMEYDGNKNGKADWLEVVAIAKSLGFTWGGDWPQFPDNPHLQMDFGYSIWELKNGNRPPEDGNAGEEKN
ncbi:MULTISPECIES: M15 family metallopeptidase [unclassified Paenibacillus]|uniref:M15 family metallopeptidase n=1 Tax=unclassified Paenibacillus TaxID=185978 RepID=UPI000419BF4C|nr:MULTISPECIES: M15 family metallopeptidase [unclassified Paenibacillus]CDN44260.1 hypothetical protein BN871_EM_00200 [Paenibacillus sp. P22]